jgi:hypothetical protein
VERRDLRVVLKIDVTVSNNELFRDGLALFYTREVEGRVTMVRLKVDVYSDH